MILNHVNLAVDDVGAAKAFLMTYFGLRDLGGGNRNRAFLMDDAGLVLSMFKAKDVRYPGTFHIGFTQASRADVDALNTRMRDDGLDVPAPVEEHGYTYYVDAPGGFQVEVLSAL